MQKFKLVTDEIGEEIKKFKKERTEDLKEIKQLYQELEQKQRNPFAPTVERISKNLAFFKEDEFKAAHATINVAAIVDKYDLRMQKINQEILKLDRVIKNGCGNIVEKSQSSRLSSPFPEAGQKELSELGLHQSTVEERTPLE